MLEFVCQVSSTAISTGKKLTVKASYISQTIVRCDGIPAGKAFFVKASNDGTSTSTKAIIHLSFDGRCQDCSTTSESQATCKPGVGREEVTLTTGRS